MKVFSLKCLVFGQDEKLKNAIKLYLKTQVQLCPSSETLISCGNYLSEVYMFCDPLKGICMPFYCHIGKACGLSNKHPAYGRHWISRPMRIIGPIPKKSRIRETLNLSTDADHRTNIFFGGGWSKLKKSKNKLHVTHDTWHVTCDTWHVTHDTWHMTRDMCHLSHVTSHLSLQEQPQPQTLPFVTCPVGAQ